MLASSAPYQSRCRFIQPEETLPTKKAPAARPDMKAASTVAAA